MELTPLEYDLYGMYKFWEKGINPEEYFQTDRQLIADVLDIENNETIKQKREITKQQKMNELRSKW